MFPKLTGVSIFLQLSHRRKFCQVYTEGN